MATITENLFDAIQILVDKSLESVKFDETINATIIDDNKAKNGQYLVSTGATNFIAYSTVTDYHKNDAVMVTIPQGNYDNQKIIIGRQVINDKTPMIYKSPLQSMIKLTNNLISNTQILNVNMWANHPDEYCWKTDTLFSKSKVYTALDQNNNKKYCVWDSGEVFYQKYDILGLSAQFSTWLNEYNTVSGNYGLMLEITLKNLEATNNPTVICSCQLDSDDFFGDIYNFETFYTQEKIFDLSNYKDFSIVRLKLFAYQRCNFIMANNEPVPYENFDNDFGEDFSNISPNIYIKDFMVFLGTNENSILSDTAEIMTDSTLTYNKSKKVDWSPEYLTRFLLLNNTIKNNEILTENISNIFSYYNTGELKTVEEYYNSMKLLLNENNIDLDQLVENTSIPITREENNLKHLNLRWVHVFEKETKIVEENEIPKNYEVRWYRYKIGASSADQFCGAHWEYLFTGEENLSTLNKINIDFQPDVNSNEERIKVIIIKKEKDVYNNIKEYKIVVSNILEFFNNTKIRDNATFEDVSALQLKVNDDFHGNYFLYNRNNQLGKNEWNTQYSITALFNNLPLEIEDCSLIQWTVPTENTMIKSFEKIGEKDNTIYYYINDVLNNNAKNNIISLKINKDGLEYAAAITLQFGTAGTNGSDYTVAIEWDNAKQAVDLNSENKELNGIIQLYDQSGSLVDLTETTIKAEWDVAVDCDLLWNNNKKSSNYIFEEEIEDIYYPVVFYNKDTKSMLPLTQDDYGYIYNENRTPIESDITSHGFYYFSDENASLNDYVYYDLNENSFKPWDNTNYNNESILSFGPVYRKKRENEKKYKISFEEIEISQDSYNPKLLYFIKYNNMYIVNPWHEYQEKETYYVPILNAPKIRDDLNQQSNNMLNIHLNGQRITIDYDNSPSINSIYILKVIISNFGDYPLIKYEPIALTNDSNIQYIEGPSNVRYATTGETDFNKNQFKIPGVDTGYWRLIIAEDFNKWNPGLENNQFNPSLRETAVDNNNQIISQKIIQIDDQDWLVYDKPILNPPALYYKDAAPYAVQFIQNKKILWTQPIFVYQDNYPSTTLNKWNGKDIITDNDTGIIIANGFAAGHKNNDNTFSGVVLGDWSRSDIDRSFATTETGVYGFNHGAMSYALKDDGTAFFGKDGRGRIYIDGNSATIKSASWRFDKPEGMMIDLDDGILDTRSSNSQVYISPRDNRLLDVKVNNTSILYVSKNNYYLQTENFNKGNRAGTKINLKDGKIESYNLNLQGYNENGNKTVEINNNGIIANAGSIGKWEIFNGAIKYSNNVYLGSDGSLKLGNNFFVSDEGELTASAGTIGGITINNSMLSASTEGGSSFALQNNGTLNASGANINGSLQAANGNFIANNEGVSITGKITAEKYFMEDREFEVYEIPLITRIRSDGTIFAKKYRVICAGEVNQDEFQIYPVTGGCFIAGTKISMANGLYKNIENIKKDDLIIAYDENKEQFVIGKVVRTKTNHFNTKMIKIILSNQYEINMTLSHPILTITGWKAIDCNTAFIEHGIVCNKLSEQDEIVTENGIQHINNIYYYDYNLPIYNFTVEKYHTYIADSCIVHNSQVIDVQK